MSAGKPLLIILLVLLNTILPTISSFTGIFSFGDSIADTGNRLISVHGDDDAGRFPYGETYFHRPTGRFSNGRLIIDFIAEAVGVPMLQPYLAGVTGTEELRRGVNFAVGGATALSSEFFREKGLVVNWTDFSLGTQIQWFRGLLNSSCSSKSDCDDILRNSLFLVGEIGGNDYNHPFFEHKTIDEIQTYVPHVVDAISSAINVFIELGAKTMVVPGNFPIGCVSSFLTQYQSNSNENYEPETGCVKWLNEFSQNHNRQLKNELDKLRLQHPDVTIIYADYYEATMSIFRSPNKFGFNKLDLSACCGGGGPYNFNTSILCGEEGSILCDDPSSYICWDGLHYTEAAYKIIADGIIKGPYAVPSISSLCLKNKLSPQPIIKYWGTRKTLPLISQNWD